MELLKKEKRNIGKLLLVLCNVLLMTAVVLFTAWYTQDTRATQEQLIEDNFCNMVESVKQLSVRHLSGELENAGYWADYIEQEHMTREQALDYIRSVSDPAVCEAHIVDMDTFEAWSTKTTKDSNTIGIYQESFASDQENLQATITKMRKMFIGTKCVLSKYTIRESQRNVIAVGLRVRLRLEDGSDRDYLLLRVIPIERMKELWLFPVNFSSAEIGLIALNGDYVIPSKSMRAENLTEFIRSYTFPDNYYGADALIEQLSEQTSGQMNIVDSKGEPALCYYSRLEDFDGLDILGFIPKSQLAAEGDDLSIVIGVAAVLLLLALLDGAYILNINRKLRATAQVAEKASQAKTQFLSSMSHDIRTPLNAVLGMTELAQSHRNDPEYVQECLRKISLSGNHLLTLINDILEISRVESGRIRVNPAPFDVQELVSNLESITRSQAVGHGLELNVVYGPLPEPWLLGDKLRLTQVYLNLLNNAVKYTNPGGSIRLEISEAPAGDGLVTLQCVVADTGIGMSAEFQQIMYESFTRVSDSRIDKIQGSGLGLSIVRRMVDLMGGSIQCDSTEGVGTTFTVRIPLPAAPAPGKEANHAEPEQLSADLTGVQILVAEDNDINWEIISEMLGGYGICCTRAENGQVCVDMLNAAPPDRYDLVLMDVQMPVLNGREAARALRSGSRADLRRIPIVAMTADAFAEDVQMCIDAGMDAHVAKPVEMDKVLAVIRRMLSRKGQDDSRPDE